MDRSHTVTFSIYPNDLNSYFLFRKISLNSLYASFHIGMAQCGKNHSSLWYLLHVEILAISLELQLGLKFRILILVLETDAQVIVNSTYEMEKNIVVDGHLLDEIDQGTIMAISVYFLLIYMYLVAAIEWLIRRPKLESRVKCTVLGVQNF